MKTAILDSDSRNICGNPIISLIFLWFYVQAILISQIHLEGLPISLKMTTWDFPGGAVVGSRPANAGDTGSSPGLGRSHMPQSN